jgi:hypothetical protein
VTEQVAVAPEPLKVQVVLLKVKPLSVLVLHVTVPVGVEGLEAVSFTDAVHVVLAFTPTGFGEQLTVVVVGSTKRGDALPLLPACKLSVGLYVPLIVGDPVDDWV